MTAFARDRHVFPGYRVLARRAALAAGVLSLPLQVGATEAPRVDWLAYAQLTAEHTDGETDFGADRVRAALRVHADRLSGTLQVDLNAGDLSTRRAGTLPNLIQDVFIDYRWHDYASTRLGQFKTPLGMDFLLSGHGLDITKRGMEKALVLERDLGFMVSGRKLPGGFGYDVGVFNPAGRSAATAHVGTGTEDQTGEDHAWATRVTYDPMDALHVEAAVGGSEAAGGPGTEDYEVFDLGVRYEPAPWTFKAEYIDGRNVLGEDGRDQRVWYAHAGYDIAPRTELVVRHYEGRSEVPTGETSLGNTFVGVTYHLRERPGVIARLQLNYVIASGDREEWTGLSGFRDDAVLLQAQVGYLP